MIDVYLYSQKSMIDRTQYLLETAAVATQRIRSVRDLFSGKASVGAGVATGGMAASLQSHF